MSDKYNGGNGIPHLIIQPNQYPCATGIHTKETTGSIAEMGNPKRGRAVGGVLSNRVVPGSLLTVSLPAIVNYSSASISGLLQTVSAEMNGTSNALIIGGFALLLFGVILARKSHGHKKEKKGFHGNFRIMAASADAGAPEMRQVPGMYDGIPGDSYDSEMASGEAERPVRTVSSGMEHVGKHILSAIHYNHMQAIPVPDASMDFRYPELEKKFHLGPGEARSALEKLCRLGYLSKRLEFETVACPACGATDPISLPSYSSKHTPGNMGETGRRRKYRKTARLVSYRCINCGMTYSSSDANAKAAYSYIVEENSAGEIPKVVPDFSRFLEVIKQFGLKAVELASFKGDSGMTHAFDLAAVRVTPERVHTAALKLDGRTAGTLLVDVHSCGSDMMDAEPVKKFYGELADLDGCQGLIIAVPGIAAEAEKLAASYGIHVLTASDFSKVLNEFWYYLKNEIARQANDSSIAFGVQGFENIAAEFPGKRTYILGGPPGSLKTTIATRYLLHGAELGENGVMVVTSQTIESMLKDFAQQGLEMDKFGRSILLVDLTTQVEDLKARISSGETSSVRSYILKIITDLGKVVLKHKAKRLVIDSISDFWPEEAINKDFLRGFILSLSRMNTTALLTKATNGEAGAFNQEGSYVDGIINLGFQSVGDARKRFIEVLKMRGVRINPSRFEIDTAFMGKRMDPVVLGRLPVPQKEGASAVAKEQVVDVSGR